MHHHDAESSNVASLGYDKDSKTLEVRFKSGATYAHTGVGEQVFHDMLASASKGSYYARNIKGKYGHKKADSVSGHGGSETV